MTHKQYSSSLFLCICQIAAHMVRSGKKHCLREMGITHAGAWVGMAQQTLYGVEAVTLIDQNAGKGMAQVVDAHILKAQ